MADDPSKVGRQDRQRINVNQDYELRDWAKKLGVSTEELKSLVARVGPDVDAVRDAVAKGGQRR
jgi:hypothetical protein